MDFFAEAFKANPSLNEGALRKLLESQGKDTSFTA